MKIIFADKRCFLLALGLCISIVFTSCVQVGAQKEPVAGSLKTDAADTQVVQQTEPQRERTVAGAATILARPEVPVLCYHHIRESKPGQSESFKSFSVTPAQFAEQMKALHDSGYQTILPDQLYNYLAFGDALPDKPVMITFDDTDEEQYSIGWQEMKKYNFKGTFFIMTVSIGKPRYMSKEQIKDLADNGNAVESHTWDHKDVRKYDSSDYKKQLINPRKTIEEITGKPATYFAYPFGAWNQNGIEWLKKADFKLAFILSTRRDTVNPLMTVRRMMVPTQWSTKGMMNAMKRTFEL